MFWLCNCDLNATCYLICEFHQCSHCCSVLYPELTIPGQQGKCIETDHYLSLITFIGCITWHTQPVLIIENVLLTLRNLKWSCVLVHERGCTDESEHQKSALFTGHCSDCILSIQLHKTNRAISLSAIYIYHSILNGVFIIISTATCSFHPVSSCFLFNILIWTKFKLLHTFVSHLLLQS